MSQYYHIQNLDKWLETALKNLKKNKDLRRHPVFIIRGSNEVKGFAMVTTHLGFNTQGRAIAEFYIPEAHEKKGWGRALAEHAFDGFKGPWEVGLSLKNTRAMGFWKQVISSYTSGEFTEKTQPDTDTYGFLFNTKNGQNINGLKKD
ncbi:MAG: hypothetical protein HUK40_02370 [Desulfobacter sp.]|nr:hypothetical protein [Desulfobacter sp.]